VEVTSLLVYSVMGRSIPRHWYIIDCHRQGRGLCPGRTLPVATLMVACGCLIYGPRLLHATVGAAMEMTILLMR